MRACEERAPRRWQKTDYYDAIRQNLLEEEANDKKMTLVESVSG
jgi:hypothetical protein